MGGSEAAPDGRPHEMSRPLRRCSSKPMPCAPISEHVLLRPWVCLRRGVLCRMPSIIARGRPEIRSPGCRPGEGRPRLQVGRASVVPAPTWAAEPIREVTPRSGGSVRGVLDRLRGQNRNRKYRISPELDASPSRNTADRPRHATQIHRSYPPDTRMRAAKPRCAMFGTFLSGPSHLARQTFASCLHLESHHFAWSRPPTIFSHITR